MNENFCVVPWAHARLNHDGRVLPCCRVDAFQSGSLGEKTFTEIWDDQPLKRLRSEFLDGKRPSACAECFQCEDNGQKSLRQTMNEMHAAEVARIETLDTRAAKLVGGEILSLDLRFSNQCNFRCRSCGPHNSLSWYRDADALKMERPAGFVKLSETPESLWALIEPLLPKVKLIYFAGGEPLIDDLHYRFLEKLIEVGRTDIGLDYNTNFSTLKWKNWDLIALWKQFRAVSIGASLDGVGEQGEILRKGMKWPEIVANHRRLKSELTIANFFIYLTVSALNAFYLPESFTTFIEEGMISRAVDFDLNIVRGPSHLRLGIFDVKERAALARKFEAFVAEIEGRLEPALVSKIRRELGAVLASIPPDILVEDRAEFKKTTIQLDRLRGERFGVAFPELFGLLYEG